MRKVIALVGMDLPEWMRHRFHTCTPRQLKGSREAKKARVGDFPLSAEAWIWLLPLWTILASWGGTCAEANRHSPDTFETDFQVFVLTQIIPQLSIHPNA